MNFSDNNHWIWLHSKDLNINHPVFEQVEHYDAILFIWDEAYFDSQFYSKQRLFFIWQCLQDFKDLPLIVIKGQTDNILKRLYTDNPNTVIYTPENPNINLNLWNFVKSLNQKQLITYSKTLPLSFSKFWKSVETQLIAS